MRGVCRFILVLLERFLLYYKYNLICFWNRLRNGESQMRCLATPITTVQVQNDGPYNPVFCAECFLSLWIGFRGCFM